MAERVHMRPLVAKIARIALVFMLVFWSSLRVEYLAFGAVPGDDGTAEQGILEDLSLFKANVEGGVADKVALSTAVGTQRALADGKPLGSIELATDAEALRLIAVPKWSEPATDDERRALFVEWKSSDPAIASVRESDGVATLEAHAAGRAVITCSLKEGFAAPLGDAFASRPCEAQFEVNVPSPEPEQVIPQVNSFQIIDSAGAVVSSDAVLALSEAERGSYAFGATLVAVDGVTGDALLEYTRGPGADSPDLEAASEGLLANLSWELVGEDGSAVDPAIATIDANGVLSMSADGALRVICTTWYAPSADRSPAWSAAVHVRSGAAGGVEEDPQGAAHPQDSLRVYANLGSAAQHGEGAGEGENGAADDGSADDETRAEVDAPDAPGNSDNSNNSDASGSSSSGSSSASASQSDADAPSAPSEPVIIERTYNVAELEALPSGTETYTMYGSKGASTVTGTGPYLVALLEDAGIPADRIPDIESLSITDYRGVVTQVSWADLMRPRSYFPNAEQGSYAGGQTTTPMVAISSYVNEEGDEGPADASKLLDNTRFRLLFGATNPPAASIDPLALRSINDIVVNLKGADFEDKNNDVFSVSVDYVPVPLGATSVFSAIPSKSIGSARFDFQWQESADGGKTWADAEGGSVQTLRRPTNSENVGKLYRVILDSNMPDEDNEGEFLSATSEPVEMTVGDGFAVVLAYDPPVAGDTAIFQSSVLGGVDPASVEYVWEMSEDGGASWQVIPNRTGPSLAVPTQPISDEDLEDPDDSGAGLIYIRVRAIASDERVAVSNAQPLTVHVGDENSDAGGKDDEGRVDGGDEPGEPSKDDRPQQNQQPDSPAGPRPGPTITEIESLVIESPQMAPSAALDPRGSARAVPSAPSQIYINEAVSEQVAEQQERIEATVPGSRWTSLKTIEPSGDDVRRILADNPFAPFVVPLGLGVTAAGGVEKLLAFRRQTH